MVVIKTLTLTNHEREMDETKTHKTNNTYQIEEKQSIETMSTPDSKKKAGKSGGRVPKSSIRDSDGRTDSRRLGLAGL